MHLLPFLYHASRHRQARHHIHFPNDYLIFDILSPIYAILNEAYQSIVSRSRLDADMLWTNGK